MSVTERARKFQRAATTALHEQFVTPFPLCVTFETRLARYFTMYEPFLHQVPWEAIQMLMRLLPTSW
eukprot:3522719-Pyramimonas_sp.AAC.1